MRATKLSPYLLLKKNKCKFFSFYSSSNFQSLTISSKFVDWFKKPQYLLDKLTRIFATMWKTQIPGFVMQSFLILRHYLTSTIYGSMAYFWPTSPVIMLSYFLYSFPSLFAKVTSPGYPSNTKTTDYKGPLFLAFYGL